MPEPTSSKKIARRHDLDALRAVAMLLGIVLHGLMPFMPGLSVIRDTQTAGWVWILFLAIHGFRMPLFFLVSGFFTAMLWQKRGVQTMLRQRSVRILLPCLLGTITIVPLDSYVGRWATNYGKRIATKKQTNETKKKPDNLYDAIRSSDFLTVKSFLDKKKKQVDINAPDPEFKMPPLHIAALFGKTKVAELLLNRGANVQQRDDGNRTALHGAAFLGRVGVVRLLLDRGIDISVRGDDDDTAIDSTNADWEMTQGIASWLRVPELDKKRVELGRERVRKLLREAGAPSHQDSSAQKENIVDAGKKDTRTLQQSQFKKTLENIRSKYAGWLKSDRFQTTFRNTDKKEPRDQGIFGNLKPRHLILSRVFDHLWFLWFLCWLIPLFVCVESLFHGLGISVEKQWPFQLNASIWWMVPITLFPQLLMGTMTPRMHFGPDTSLGILPQPHLIVYYAIFFGFGMSMFVSGKNATNLGQWWPCHFLGAALCFPTALVTMGNPALTAIPQILFAWLTCFGLIGAFRSWCSTESRAIRYISDSSYWLYLMHIPLVIALACLIQTWRLPVFVKLCVICFGTTFILLITYQLFVRYTWIGLMLHGSRKKIPLQSGTP
ncbi:MAG: acyltransferase family protein [Planctomycetaceae bacterium]|nr:acyltransferase family protein [Planctomycetaceae bacterium]